MSGLNIQELGPHPSDDKPLDQGSYHRDRVFINENKDREVFKTLLTDSVPLKTFCRGKTFKCQNSELLFNIVKRLSQTNSEMPEAYANLFLEVTKNTAVAGLLQVNKKEALKHLRSFCLREINIRDCQYLKAYLCLSLLIEITN